VWFSEYVSELLVGSIFKSSEKKLNFLLELKMEPVKRFETSSADLIHTPPENQKPIKYYFEFKFEIYL
jgi:hypothetical protein